MKALRRLTVRAAVPAELSQLSEIVSNLRWSWDRASGDLFQAVDPELWESCEHDPGRMLGAVSAQRLAALAVDSDFRARVDAVHAGLQRYLTEPRWYQKQQAAGRDLPAAIGYFSPEFGITETLPQYSGGLGILAGDHLKAASDLGVPIIGVGLLYGAGYFRQSLSSDGWQLEHYPNLDPQGLPIAPLYGGTPASGGVAGGGDQSHNPVRVVLDLPDGRVLHAQIWVARVGRVPLLMLDTDLEENDAALRQVTDRLYGGGVDHRLEQELLLGIGGVRAIRAYCAVTGTPAPEVFHTNEGHAGFLGIERIRELTAGGPPGNGGVAAAGGYGLSFDEALSAVRAGTIFTTHTPVPAGIDRFPRELVAAYLGNVPGVPLDRILALGAEDDHTIFNMAHMGLRLGQRANGVSVLHGKVSRGMFAKLWPGFDEDEVPISSITNGVHASTWVARDIIEMAEREVGTQAVAEGRGWEVVEKVSDEELWRVRGDLRERLVHEIRRRVFRSHRERGASEPELKWINSAFDPNVLTIGFARRVPSYKRLTLMLCDPERLTRILLDPDKPVQIVLAGKSHPADEGGKQLIQRMVEFADDPAVRHRITFLPDYDIKMARYLYWGVDVWLNNPLRPLEACGTSGMKAALNGALNLSILDGWWDEWYDGENGWAIPSADGVVDDARRDAVEAEGLYELLETQVAPRFYDRDAQGVPKHWVQMVRHTLKELAPKVMATRMVTDYVEQLYAPAAQSARSMYADGFAPAKAAAAWRAKVQAAWSGVKVLYVDSQLSGHAELGGTLHLRAEVALNGLAPDEVTVEAAFGLVDTDDRIVNSTTVPLASVDSHDGSTRFEGTIPLERAGAFGYTVRVLPCDASLASPVELGLVAFA